MGSALHRATGPQARDNIGAPRAPHGTLPTACPARLADDVVGLVLRVAVIHRAIHRIIHHLTRLRGLLASIKTLPSLRAFPLRRVNSTG